MEINMARKARDISSSGVYHVILRSINQQQIFEDRDDFIKFIYILSDCQKKYDFEIYAYCLMSNHIHILISYSKGTPGPVLQSIGVRFVTWYNKKYQRFGHLFQGRFISRAVESKNYFFRALFYIHENPVKAHICRHAAEYPWSSYSSYLGQNNFLLDINTQKAISLAGSAAELHRYWNDYSISLLENPDRANTDESIFEIPSIQKSLIDERALHQFSSITGCRSPSDFQNLPRPLRNEYIHKLHEAHLSYNQIARYGGVSKTTVHRVLKH